MKLILYFVIIIFPLTIYAQHSNLKEFNINGIVNIDTGIVSFEMAEVKELYPASFNKVEVKIRNGKFNIKGKTDYPIWCVFRLGDKYVSSSTPINFGVQSIILNIDSNYQEPKNNNAIAAEIAVFNSFSVTADKMEEQYRRRRDSLDIVYKNKVIPDEVKISLANERRLAFDSYDSTLLEYIKSNPNSYYALFKLYHLIGFGYNNTLGAAYDYFSGALKSSYYGKELSKNIMVAKRISVGAIIPELNVQTNIGRKIEPKPYKPNRYTLIDFWYSSCMPCISQFPDLVKIRNEYKNKGFEILGISIDKEKYRKNWQDAIIKYNMSWPQYLDLNGVEAKSLKIKVYPTNFLVDQSGKIVATNILPAELRYFLVKNLD